MPKVVIGKSKLCSCDLRFFKSEQGIEKLSLFERYPALETIVNKKISQKYRHFLAQPIKDDRTIVWYAIPFNEIPRQLSALKGEEQVKYKKIKEETLGHFVSIINALKQEYKINEAEYLEKAIKYVNDNFVYCYDGKTILAIWGMQLREDVREPLGIAMKPLFVQPGQPFIASKSIPDPELPQQQPGPELVSEPNLEQPKSFNVTFNAGLGGNIIGNSILNKQNGEILSDNEIPAVEAKEHYEFIGWDKNPNKFIVTGDTEFTAQYKEPSIIDALPWYMRFWNWLKTLFIGKGCLKWLVWLLLFLLLLLLLSWLFRSCNGNGNVGIDGGYNQGLIDDPRTGDGGIYNPGNPYTPVPTPNNPDLGFKDILPPSQGVLPPIDTTKIIREPGNLVVIGNRLNILMENEDKSILELAKDFKLKYPGDNYKVVYYDDVVKRMQIELPSDERINLKQEIPAKFAPDYKLFVFDEALFEDQYSPNDPAFNDTTKSWYLHEVKAPEAWDITRGSSKIQIAIVDDGFSLKNPEINSKVIMPYNVWTHSKDIFPQKIDHGTHVAGIALALMDNGKGLAGIAPECQFIPVQVANSSGVMTTTSILDGILYALYQGADVVNVSLGTDLTGFKNCSEKLQRELLLNHFKEEERLWNEIIQIADKHNASIVVAAGNENILAGIDPLQRPKHIITVSAVNKNNHPYSKAEFSNYGSYSTISAPGVDIYSTIGNNGYTIMDGTSMAAPIVTGGIALMKSLNESLTNEQIIKILQTTGLATDGNIGNLIQLDKALEMVESGKLPEEDPCEKIAGKIDSLQREIERLKKLCQNDTLTIKDLIPGALIGKWKTIDPIHNTRTGELLVETFEFNGSSGQLTIVEEDGNTCKAPLSIKIKNGKLMIVQTSACICEDGNQYIKYKFLTYSDNYGKVICEFQNTKDKSNFFKSYLVRTN